MAQVDDKLSRSEFTHTVLPELQSKLTKDDLELFKSYIDEVRVGLEGSVHESVKNSDHFIGTVRRELDTFALELATKVEKVEMNSLASARKADNENFKQIFEIQKSEIAEIVSLHKSES